MIIDNCEQLSPQWYSLRAGIPSASNFNKIVTGEGAYSKQQEKYMLQLAGERIIGTKEETYQSNAMLIGIEREAEARALYAMANDAKVQEVGLCYKDESKLFSCSPDGLVGEDGLLEIKCPLLATQIGYLLADKLPTDYIQQVQGQLYVTGRKWCDFMSYYPGVPPFIIRVERDEEFIKKLDAELTLFCAKLDEISEKLAKKL